MPPTRKTVEIRYKVFRMLEDPNPPHGMRTARVENCTPDGFETEQQANDWIFNNGDFRTLNYEYTVMRCQRIVGHYD